MSKSAAPVSALKTYTPKERNMYLVGMFGQNIFFNVIAGFTNYYMTNVLYISAATVGIILVVAQVFDAFNDPVMGTIMDRTRTRIGKARPFLLIVPIIVAFMTIACFSLPSVGETAVPEWGVALLAAGFYIFWGIAYTAGDIPLWGLTALMTEDKKHQEIIQAAARLAAGIGAAIPVLAFQPVSILIGKKLCSAFYEADYPGFTQTFNNLETAHEPDIALKIHEIFNIDASQYVQNAIDFEKKGFIYTAIAFTILAYVTFQMVGIFAREKITPSEKKNSVWANFAMMAKNKPYRQILLSGILSSPRNITMIVALPMVTLYFATKDPSAAMKYMVMLGGPLFGGMFIATALVPKLSEKWGKKTLYNASNLLEIIPNLSIFVLFILQPDKMDALYLIIPMMGMFLLKGTCLGLFNVLQTNMIADAVDYEDYTNHIRPDGVFFSGQTFMVKIGTGISNIIWLSGLCTWVGYSGDNIKAINDMVARSNDKLPSKMGSDFFGVLRRFFENHFTFPQTAENTIHTAVLRDPRDPVQILNTVTLTADQLHMFFAIMFFAVSIVPAIGNILAVLPMRNYAMDTPERNRITAELQARRRAEGELVEDAE
ncbi:MAG: MFS transporter [Oscillospiraceae bacterium]|jgi:Na+/melibiose symporter-like transporter|nr:MFS transporter [Oscillospiraceae bacterium]